MVHDTHYSNTRRLRSPRHNRRGLARSRSLPRDNTRWVNRIRSTARCSQRSTSSPISRQTAAGSDTFRAQFLRKLQRLCLYRITISALGLDPDIVRCRLAGNLREEQTPPANQVSASPHVIELWVNNLAFSLALRRACASASGRKGLDAAERLSAAVKPIGAGMP